MERTERRTASDLVVVDVPAPGVVSIRMADVAGHNGLSPALTEALLDALRQVTLEAKTRVVILCGSPEYFCTGATPELLAALGDGRMRPTELGLARRVLELEVPVIAACAGAAIGGGLVLATACDLVLLARERRYGFNFMDLGITPGMGATALADHVFGTAVTHELLYSGEFRLGADLARCSGVSEVAPSAGVEERALQLALRMAGRPRRNLSMLKRTLTLPRRRRLEEALTLESLMHETSLGTLDVDGLGDDA